LISRPFALLFYLYSQFNVLPLSQIIELEQVNYMFALSNNLLPEVFGQYCAKPSHRYKTRYSISNYSIAPYISKISESSIKVIGPKVWAKVPKDIKSLPFRKTFSKKLKQLYLGELPTEKRTKKLDFLNSEKTEEQKRADLQKIFDEPDDDSTFLGFVI